VRKYKAASAAPFTMIITNLSLAVQRKKFIFAEAPLKRRQTRRRYGGNKFSLDQSAGTR